LEISFCLELGRSGFDLIELDLQFFAFMFYYINIELIFILVDLVTERDREIAAWKELEASLRGEVASLVNELEATKKETSQKNQVIDSY
jgi:hypothetical protein